MKQLIRKIVPSALLCWWHRCRAWRWFHGNYSNWPEAREASAGYDHTAVLARVVAATRQVKAGQACWERDGWVFDTPEVNQPLLSALRGIAQENNGVLEIIDFGGSLGSTWWQHRAELETLAAVHWKVVEQSHYVAAGAEFADRSISFYGSINEALSGGRPSVMLFSSVLSYLENPWSVLKVAACCGIPHIIIDRTPLVAGRTRLTVQRTPPALGGGSYPCWLFRREELLAKLNDTYVLVSEWPAIDDLAADVQHRGFHFQRIV